LRRNECRDGRLVVETSLGIKLEKTVRQLKLSRPITAANEHLVNQFDPREFKSPILLDIYAKARKFSALKIPVLILGERGTGKSYLANWIRANSPFRKKELDNGWPAVACGQYSKSDSIQLQATLFGSKKGAYTDAKEDRVGLLKKADKDTLFLDEIGDISQITQRLLIKALEEKTFHPLGSDSTEQSDFRLITATNKKIDVLKKEIDPDFFDRVCQLIVTMPPLREIREDIPFIWMKTFESAIKASNASVSQEILDEVPHDEIILRLQRHELPGNYRDLQRVANNMIIYLHNPDASIEYSKIFTEAFNSLSSSNNTQAMAVAKAFAAYAPLDSYLAEDNISTDSVFRDLKLFLARELSKIADAKDVSVDTLCDVSSRTIANWLK
jgi:DNA-binding NtrC family response regulator